MLSDVAVVSFSVARAEFHVGVLQRSFCGKSCPARIPTHLVNPAKLVMLAFVCHLQEKLFMTE